MRLISNLTHSTTLFWLQQAVTIWFVLEFFLARDSNTANKLFREHSAKDSNDSQLIHQRHGELMTRFGCHDFFDKRPTFDKVILIVIDALGVEFIPSLSPDNKLQDGLSKNQLAYQYKMPFLEQALKSNQAMGFIAKAATPTVTMPRIKSLVSGTIPSFMDLVYNLANDVSDFHDDNLLRLARAKNRSIVFYGDDTWLTLFDRSIFKRSRETLSLYASDYTTVDTNVTERALPETKRNPLDWDYLILHYLGLDHIGHVFGSNEAQLITPKLNEMDGVIREIYNDMAGQKDIRSLIVVCGDHGMSREGNHGGDTPLESDTALIFLPLNMQLSHWDSQNGEATRVQQIDLAATLSILNGLPIPSNSRGVIIDDLLRSLWDNDTSKLTCAFLSNMQQLSRLPYVEFSSYYLSLLNIMIHDKMKRDTESHIREGLRRTRSLQAVLDRTVTAKSNPLHVLLALAFVMLLSLINMRKSCLRLLMPLMTTREKLTCLGAILVPIVMLNSTDFIEMEHTFWPVCSLAVFVLLVWCALQSQSLKHIKQDLEIHRIVLFAIAFAITVLWNNLSWLGPRDLGWSLPVISVIVMCNFSRQTSALEGRQTVIFFATGLLVFVTKMVEETEERHENHHTRVAILQLFACVSLLLITVINICTSYAKHDTQATSIVQKLATSWMWWVLLLSRSRNYVFLIANVVMEASLNSLVNTLRLNPIARAILYILFSSNAFYGQGNTNLFSSLDIKPAFFAQTRYSLVLAIPLVACATFGAQIYWYLKLFQRVQGEKEQERMMPRHTGITAAAAVDTSSTLIPAGTKDAIKDLVDMRNFLTIGYYMFVCAVLRNHLFIWSVISPKLVYLYMGTLSLRITTTMISNAPHLWDKFIQSGNRALPGQYKLLTD